MSARGKPRTKELPGIRFMRHVDFEGKHWIWQGWTEKAQFRIDDNARITPARAAWLLFVGKIQKGRQVVNVCGRHDCCRPGCHRALLPSEVPQYSPFPMNGIGPQLAAEIREAYAAGTTTASALKRAHGLSMTTIHLLLIGDRWLHAGGPILPRRERKRLGFVNRVRSSAHVAVAVREEYAKGEQSQAQIAEAFGITKEQISRVLSGKVWPKLGGPIVPAKTRLAWRNRKRAS